MDLYTFLLVNSREVYPRLIPTRHRASGPFWDPGSAHGSERFSLISTHIQNPSSAKQDLLMRFPYSPE